jgi:hypothetical protein
MTLLAQRVVKSREITAIPAPILWVTVSRMSAVKGRGLATGGGRGDVSLICVGSLAYVTEVSAVSARVAALGAVFP